MKKVRIGFIGAGWWPTTNHMPLMAKRNDVEMTAVCTIGKDMLQKVKESFGFSFATEDYHELLEQDLDGVFVCTPHRMHYEHARAALDKGFHVLCEKPMTLLAKEAWDLVHLAKKRKVEILVPLGWHYKPFIQKAKQLMDQGVTGQVEYVLCHMASPTKTFFAGQGGIPTDWKPTLAEPDPSNWQVKENGGGYGHGQLPHSTALMFWLTGLRVRETTARMTSPNSDVDMYNTASVVFDNGAVGTISGAATLPEGSPFQIELTIFGEKGVLLLDLEQDRLEVRCHDGSQQQFPAEKGEGTYCCNGPPGRFIELIQGSGRNDSPGEVAARSVELITAMYESAENNGQYIKIF